MSHLTDYGKLSVNLGLLKEKVQALPKEAWRSRIDPESYTTSAIREGDPCWKTFKKELDELLNSIYEYLPPGYQNRVVLSMIPAGEKILPHTDDFGAEVQKSSIHCHIPLITHPDVKMGFTENKIEYHLEEGHLYSMDETILHYVNNDSDVDRVHLLFAHWKH